MKAHQWEDKNNLFNLSYHKEYFDNDTISAAFWFSILDTKNQEYWEQFIIKQSCENFNERFTSLFCQTVDLCSKHSNGPVFESDQERDIFLDIILSKVSDFVKECL